MNKKITLVTCYFTALLILPLFAGFTSCDAGNREYPCLFVCSDTLESPYGLCTHINRKGDRYEFDTREKEIEMIHNVGAEWIRTDFDRGRFVSKEAKNEMVFTHFDKVMETVGLDKLGMLGIISRLKEMGQIDEWRNYVCQIARRYQSVSHWEIINEADSKYGKNGLLISDYVKLLKEGYFAIKEGNQESKVLISGLAHSMRPFMDTVFASGGADYFDIMNVHHYSNKRREPEEFIEFYNQLSDKMAEYKVEKPVWLTETGCSSAPNWASEEVQAQRLPRIFLISFACGIDKVFWYKTRSNELKEADKECHFGLWHKNYSPKPAYYAYQTLVNMCPDKSVRPKLRRQGDIYMAQWMRPDKKIVWAIWSQDKHRNVGLTIEGKYVCYDTMGNVVQLHGKTTDVSPSVVYIVGAKSVILENVSN